MFSQWIRGSSALACLLILAGCGGGDEGGGGILPATSFSVGPQQLTITQEQGEGRQAVIDGILGSKIEGPVYIGVIDLNNTFNSDFQLEFTSNISARLTLSTQVTLPLGIRSGRLQVYACKDQRCTAQHPGSPVEIPYTVTVQPGPPAAQITPATLSLTAYVNEPITLNLEAKLSKLASGAYYFRLSDEQNLLAGQLQNISAGINSVNIGTTLTFTRSGTYSGVARLHACFDSICSSEAPGSPVALPYTLVVAPAGTLTTLPAPIGLPDWETYQGNAAHNAYVPVTLNPTRFNRRWVWTAPNSGMSLSAPVVAGGKLLVSTKVYFDPGYLYALNEADGSLAWTYDFGELPALNPPAASGDRVYIASSGHARTFLFNLNLASGALNSQTAFSAQWESYLSPTVKDGMVFNNGGYFGGLYAWSASNGEQQWYTRLPQVDGWTPAVDGSYAYAYTNNQLHLLDRNSGSLLSTTGNAAHDTRRGIVPVLTGSNSVAVATGVALVRYARSGTNLVESWRQAGSYAAEPVARGGTLYAASSGPLRVEARNEANGNLLWQWTPGLVEESYFAGNLIVTDNLAFIATRSQTFAIDLATQQTVWTFPYGGQLALSANRILYVQTGQDKIYAINVF